MSTKLDILYSQQHAAGRVNELENMVQEMNRTRKCMEQLVTSLEAQKHEKDEQLHVCQIDDIMNLLPL